ncbi:MAG: DUF1343 domain-containing protein [Deltaproteobacteria bacterium]|nr:DUF1343 domain-containing protein [Deltaproteobacteria bacterium]
MQQVVTGLENLIKSPPEWLAGKAVGLLCNPASVDSRLRHARLLIDSRLPCSIRALFSPQHGFFSEKQDNMVASEDLLDPLLRVPVYSLYGKTRIPEPRMFADIDVLIIDLQDVGTRVYTFMYTMAYCLEAARQHDVKVLLLDRPNPVGGLAVEGNCLSPEYTSFVGRYPIPMRHGLTMGELALLFNRQYGISCNLEVVPMSGWKRGMLFSETGLPWVAPSPNLPTPASAMVYPGQVIWEGTNVSEGRGTTQPFELCGAPYIDPVEITAFLHEKSMPGVILRSTAFEPTANKWRKMLCRGFQIHIHDPGLYRPYAATLLLLQGVISCHAAAFEWKKPPYEYEFKKLPIDLIIGSREIRERVENLEPLETIINSWKDETESFRCTSRKYYLYDS